MTNYKFQVKLIKEVKIIVRICHMKKNISDKKNKNKGGRPTKLTDNFIKVIESVLNEDINAIIFTDDELWFQINEKLPKTDKISYTTFKNWKSESKNKSTTDEKILMFLSVYKKALSKQKANLFEQLRNEPSQWQKWAWIIERKFSSWNLKHIGEVDHTTKGDKINKVDITDEQTRRIAEEFLKLAKQE